MHHLAHYVFHSTGALIGGVAGFVLLAYENSCTPDASVPLLMHCTTIIGTGPMEPLAAVGIGAVVGLVVGQLVGGSLAAEL
jgi:hypothetical protein